MTAAADENKDMQAEKPKIELPESLLSACIHCGLCLPACPTYLATGREMESPRGRIYLMGLVGRGEAQLEGKVAEHLESCLGCLGCQTACPSGVQYGTILDAMRPHLARVRSSRARAAMRFSFKRLLPDYRLLGWLANILRLWQSMGSLAFRQRAIDWLPLPRKLVARLKSWQAFLPVVPAHKRLPRQASPPAEKGSEVDLFCGCVMDIFYNHINHACVRLLTRQGQAVSLPEQTCCGALAFHAGETDIARELAKRNIDLAGGSTRPLVVTAAGCGAMLKSYGELFEEEDRDWKEKAQVYSRRVVDATEFLAAHEFASQPAPLDRKVAYHAACHLYHAQRVREAPANLLKAIPHVVLAPLDEAEHCCGSAGIFNLTHTNLSLAVLSRKADFIAASGADMVVTTNPGCLLQIDAGLKEAGLDIPVRHLLEVMDEAYERAT